MRMDAHSRRWYQQECRYRLRSLQGNAFQDFFAHLMEIAHPGDFQRIRPYGSEGDH
jgi:hypothetical protein